MVEKLKTAARDIGDRFPQTLSIKDLITIVSVAVSMALAWGVFSTRITILEKETVELKQSDAKQVATIETLHGQIRKLETRLQDNQQFVDDLYRSANKPLPRRTSDL